MAQRTKPNVLITGTPGVGKTSTAEQVAAGLVGKSFIMVDFVRGNLQIALRILVEMGI
jgi:broad-specificity NMP kinase